MVHFLAQHCDQVGRTAEAVTLIDRALLHTPTLPELFMTKAKIFKVCPSPICTTSKQLNDTCTHTLSLYTHSLPLPVILSLTSESHPLLTKTHFPLTFPSLLFPLSLSPFLLSSSLSLSPSPVPHSYPPPLVTLSNPPSPFSLSPSPPFHSLPPLPLYPQTLPFPLSPSPSSFLPLSQHGGDDLTAAQMMEEAQSLDTADRFVTSKCCKYLMRVNRIERAVELVSLFTRVRSGALGGKGRGWKGGGERGEEEREWRGGRREGRRVGREGSSPMR